MEFMESLKNYNPIKFLDEFRGKDFKSEWPTVPEMFCISVKRFPERPCFTDWDNDDESKRTYSYIEVLKKVLSLAQWMREFGIKKGDRVAVSGKNSPEWAIVYLAALFADAIVCPLDYALHESEVENLLATAKPVLFFVDKEKFDYFSNGKFDFKVYALNRRTEDSSKYIFNLISQDKSSFENLKPEDIHCNSNVVENDTAAILFTSGTTGKPKGVMLSHKNLVSDCYIGQSHMILHCTDVFYALLPIHHAYTMLAVFIEAISVGAGVVFGKSMSVSKLLKELKEGKVTMLLGVPMLFNKLSAGIINGIKAKGPIVNGIMHFLMGVSFFFKKVFRINIGHALFKSVLKKASLDSIRIAICGGGPLAKSVFKIYQQLGIDFVQGYGLTETSPIIALNPIQHFKIESVGQYFKGYMEMKINEPNEDGIGEICVKGPMVMQGYYNMPEETAAMFTEDGWFKTGDLGWLDDEGYLMLSGRCKNMIVTEGGKNVYPEEIEDAFQLEDEISQITVRGYVENESKKAESLEALVYPADSLYSKLGITRDTKTPAAEEAVKKRVFDIVDKINRNLQPYQRITNIIILEKPLEMTTTLKVKRTQIVGK